jgi:hypothetical protein
MPDAAWKGLEPILHIYRPIAFPENDLCGIDIFKISPSPVVGVEIGFACEHIDRNHARLLKYIN